MMLFIFELLPPILNFVGAIIVGLGVVISDKEILNIGMMRWGYDNDEDNKKLPNIKDRMKQRKLTIVGLGLLLVGLTLEIISNFV